jgi:hypothetical protein
MKYQILINEKTQDVIGIKRISDNAGIPLDPANTDYQAFLKYQAEGGKVYGADEPLPADEVTE